MVNLRWTGLLLITAGALGLTVWQTVAASPIDLGGSPAVTHAAASLLAGQEPTAKYLGNGGCRTCHKQQFKGWVVNKKHSRALDTLQPGQRAAEKTKAGLDPDKDYSYNIRCLKCHTVGLGAVGGYFIPREDDREAAKRARGLRHVGCEMCHGPGGKYVSFHEDISKSKRTYTAAEMRAAGLQTITEATCTKCHNDQSPTHDPAEPFDFEKCKEAGTHEHYPLKQRRG